MRDVIVSFIGRKAEVDERVDTSSEPVFTRDGANNGSLIMSISSSSTMNRRLTLEIVREISLLGRENWLCKQRTGCERVYGPDSCVM